MELILLRIRVEIRPHFNCTVYLGLTYQFTEVHEIHVFYRFCQNWNRFYSPNTARVVIHGENTQSMEKILNL